MPRKWIMEVDITPGAGEAGPTEHDLDRLEDELNAHVETFLDRLHEPCDDEEDVDE
jgi:hypothetical protein